MSGRVEEGLEIGTWREKKPSELRSHIALPLVSEVSVAACTQFFVLAVMLWALVQQVCSRAATHYRTMTVEAAESRKQKIPSKDQMRDHFSTETLPRQTRAWD